ncbi:lysylphosphatidylglycerol synthase transmembrane domain-containing protein [Nocardioides iriomotensis]|uniref:Flippase-like domain-containing protein n=1 Tax=Nocardioides iriomotensis TaxID=715784 RepID=A0A4Q5J376_9ACTN|nr:flippase-like domain-containing protein [Nocardioides iriomotensis]RYU12924.1 flippase-like domain-containing protein [Nocardioides iriomotensis]
MNRGPSHAGRPARHWLRRWGPRGVALAVTGIGLYVVAPSLLAMLDAWPQLEAVRPRWFVLLAALEVGSFVALWGLTRIALSRPRHVRRAGPGAAGAGHGVPAHAGHARWRRARSVRWADVARAQLVGNAASRVLPGGAATGTVVQGRMLLLRGHPADRVASALTAVGLLTTGVLATLPVLTVPAVLIGPPPAHELQLGLVVSLVLAVVVVGLGVLALTVPRVLVSVGFAVGGVLHLLGVRVTAAGVGLALARQRARVRAAFFGNWWRSVMAAAAHRMLDYAALVAALVAVGAQARPSLVLLAYVVAAVMGMVPLTPGGLGFVETGLTGALVLAGVSADAAVLATLLYRLVSFWLPIPAGAIAWASLTVRRPEAAPLRRAGSPVA